MTIPLINSSFNRRKRKHSSVPDLVMVSSQLSADGQVNRLRGDTADVSNLTTGVAASTSTTMQDSCTSSEADVSMITTDASLVPEIANVSNMINPPMPSTEVRPPNAPNAEASNAVAEQRPAAPVEDDLSTFVNVIQTIGEGAFGEVKLVADSRNPTIVVAMKCVDLSAHAEMALQLKKEAVIHRSLTKDEYHHNLVRYIGMRVERNLNQFQMFLEYADGGELFDQIEPDVGMPEDRAQFFYRQLMDGLEYIHGHGISHRDIKPENLLLTKGDQLKISDFGMATIFRHKEKERYLDAPCGTPPYAAPEVYDKKYRGEGVDIWSSGIVLVAMLAGELPWDQPTRESEPFCSWRDGLTTCTSPPWSKISPAALSLIKGVLRVNPKERYRISQEIRQHPWFTYNYDSAAQPASKRQRLEVINEMEATFSQPAHMAAPFECGMAAPQKAAFSQPVSIDSMILGTSQILSQNVAGMDPLQSLVRRLTRFCVKVTIEQLLPYVYDVCAELGYAVREKPPNQILVTVRDMSFIISMYQLKDQGVMNVLVDFRRSKGDGLEFKRAFVQMRELLRDLICQDSYKWLESVGLSCSQTQDGKRAW